MMHREPCPVCGHPTGDCKGEGQVNIRPLGANLFPSLGYRDVFIVEEDVYEDRPVVQGQEWNPEGLTVKTRVLKKGQQIPLSVAIERGLTTA